MRESSSELGLTPIARARVQGTAQAAFDFGDEPAPAPKPALESEAAPAADPWAFKPATTPPATKH